MGVENLKPTANSEAEGDENAEDGEPTAARRPDRSGLLIAGAVLAACGGLVLYGVLDTEDKPEKPHVASAAVTYEVAGKGTADITYQARSETGQAVTVDAARLPWRATVDVPLGQDPVISIVLGEKGGQARCTLAVRGRYVQSATASGRFGRATCAGALPVAARSPDGSGS
ncbi:hypothetical protein [Streptomyces sp. NPDC101165]|uniref:hypothetical protein n=1 Tax=Streptomyces sp. NPDC101165 TaxID=3366119 RepID=UPI003800EC3B